MRWNGWNMKRCCSAAKSTREVGLTNSERQKAITTAMQTFAVQTNDTGLEGLRRVFAKIQARGAHPPSVTANAQLQNKKKCRYSDVACIDQTRVILKPWPNAEGDFIHANWVTDDLLGKKFICTQGPLDGTIGDFWRMIWQENVDLIIMLCRITELGKKKCAQYWPNNVGESRNFCGITIKNEKFSNDQSEIWSTNLSLYYGSERRSLTHHQWVTWPDKFVPKHLVVPYTLLSSARTSMQPTVIHCSAGIGRTGTMVVLELAIKTLLRGRILSLPDVIWNIRSQRSKAVQNEEQYLYIHYLIIQRLVNKGAIASSTAMSKFCRDYEHYYFIRTHDVQIPLPVFLRKKAAVPSRKPISLPERGMVEPISITPPAGTPSDKCQSSAADENALVSLRLPPTRRKQPGKLKTNAVAKVATLQKSNVEAERIKEAPLIPVAANEMKRANEVLPVSTIDAKTMRRTEEGTAMEETPAKMWLLTKGFNESEPKNSIQGMVKPFPLASTTKEDKRNADVGTSAKIYPLVEATNEGQNVGPTETVAKMRGMTEPMQGGKWEKAVKGQEQTTSTIVPDADDVEKALLEATRLVRHFLSSRSAVDELFQSYRSAQKALDHAFVQAQFALALTFAMQQVHNSLNAPSGATIPNQPTCNQLPRSPKTSTGISRTADETALPIVVHTAEKISMLGSSSTEAPRLCQVAAREESGEAVTTAVLHSVASEKTQATLESTSDRKILDEKWRGRQNEKTSTVDANEKTATVTKDRVEKNEEDAVTAIPKLPEISTAPSSSTQRTLILQDSNDKMTMESTANLSNVGIKPSSAPRAQSPAKIGEEKEGTCEEDEEDSTQYVFVQPECGTARKVEKDRPVDAFCEPLSNESMSSAAKTSDQTGATNTVDNTRSIRAPVSSYLMLDATVRISDIGIHPSAVNAVRYSRPENRNPRTIRKVIFDAVSIHSYVPLMNKFYSLILGLPSLTD
uniref:Protein-tyrosine phosphatase n=1 Tax=Ascaris lumbricoides TaxID=6252 RepID=A0A0M3HPT8_ASCLU